MMKEENIKIEPLDTEQQQEQIKNETNENCPSPTATLKAEEFMEDPEVNEIPTSMGSRMYQGFQLKDEATLNGMPKEDLLSYIATLTAVLKSQDQFHKDELKRMVQFHKDELKRMGKLIEKQNNNLLNRLIKQIEKGSSFSSGSQIDLTNDILDQIDQNLPANTPGPSITSKSNQNVGANNRRSST